MKFILIFLLLLTTPLVAKECFKDKQSEQQICYKRYFDRSKIYKASDEEKYYTSNSGKIYAIGDKIEVKFNAVGAILSILDDYEIDFVDKTKAETYIFQVRNKNELFGMLRILNNLDAVQKAIPLTERKYTKAYVEYQRKKQEEKLEKIQENLESNKQEKTTSNKLKNANFQGGNFLQGGVK